MGTAARTTPRHTVGTESGCSVWYTDPVHIVVQYRSQSRLSRLLLYVYRTPCTDRRRRSRCYGSEVPARGGVHSREPTPMHRHGRHYTSHDSAARVFRMLRRLTPSAKNLECNSSHARTKESSLMSEVTYSTPKNRINNTQKRHTTYMALCIVKLDLRF